VENRKMDNTDTFEVKELIRILIRKKWLLLGSFLIILIIGLIFTFMAAPQFGSESKITISEGFSYYNNEYYSLFPNEAKGLWIFPTSTLAESTIRKLQKISGEIISTETLTAVSKELGISVDYLRKNVVINLDTGKRVMSINTFYSDAETAYKINKSLTDYYFKKTVTDLDSARKILIGKIDEKITPLKKEIDDLSVQAEKYVTDYNLNLISEEAKNNSGNIAFRGLDFIKPSLKVELDNRNAIYYEINLMKDNLSKNGDYFINRLDFTVKPEVSNEQLNGSHTRNAAFSVIAAIILSLLVVYFVSYIQSLRKSSSKTEITDKK
jgi:capsular polysaccharide biosynthesis protein